MRHRLTNGVIRNLPTPATGNKIVYDGDVKGLGIRIRQSLLRSELLPQG